MLLDDAEIKKLTKKVHRDAQMRELVFLGIKHKVRSDGSIVVSRAHVEQVLGVEQAKAPKDHEPDFDALKPKVSL